MINVLEDAGSHKPSPTCLALRMLKHIQVAPHVGAWIETLTRQNYSLPSPFKNTFKKKITFPCKSVKHFVSLQNKGYKSYLISTIHSTQERNDLYTKNRRTLRFSCLIRCE